MKNWTMPAAQNRNFKHTVEETILEEVQPEIDSKKFEDWNMIDISFWVREKLGLDHLDMQPWNQNQLFGEDLLQFDELMLYKTLKVSSRDDRRTILLAMKGMSDYQHVPINIFTLMNRCKPALLHILNFLTQKDVACKFLRLNNPFYKMATTCVAKYNTSITFDMELFQQKRTNQRLYLEWIRKMFERLMEYRSS